MMANYRGIPGLVQIGINDTPLTSAIEGGDFKTAERLIEESVEPSYLDEGPFEKIPLALVLSNNTEFRKFPRHLRLARLLVEGGANPNLRIPQAEWPEASPSPMEHVWVLHACADDFNRNGSDSLTFSGGFVDPLFTIGLHDETELTLVQLKEQLLELLDIFLACGGNPNVITSVSNSTLFHVAVAHPDPDMEVVMKLCEAGGDLNMTNVHGTTPLMDLILSSDGDLAVDILYNIWKKKPVISSLQTQNCSNETALSRSMFSGSPTIATELLHQGASPDPRATVISAKWNRVGRPGNHSSTEEIAISGVSAILLPLLQDSSPYLRHRAAYLSLKPDVSEALYPFHVHLLDKVFSCTISPVVDNTSVHECFSQAVLDEIEKIINEETQFAFDSLLLSAIKPQDVMILMFGKLGSGLQQLCVRRIIDLVFFTKDPCKSLELIAKLKGKKLIAQKEQNKSENFDEKGGKKDTDEVESSENIVVEDMDNITHWDIVMEFNKTALNKLVKELLNLPPSLTSRFEIEATRLQLGATLYNFKSVDCILGCDGQSDEELSDMFPEDEYNEYDDDDDDDDMSDWLVCPIRFDDDDDDGFMNSDTEPESSEGDSSEDSGGVDDDDDGDDDDCHSEDDNADLLYIDEKLDATSPMGMNVDTAADEDDNSIEEAEPDQHYSLPSITDSDGLEKGSTVSEDNSSSAVECMPGNIRRDKYEAFSNDTCDDTVSSEDESLSAGVMDASDELNVTEL